MTLFIRSSRPQSTRLRIKLGYYAAVPVVSASLLLAFLLHPALAKSRKPEESGIHKIKHVIVIMQENRSFDSYFGTYPGAEGFPTGNGVPTVCNPDPRGGGCIKPYHDAQDANGGGPHGEKASMTGQKAARMPFKRPACLPTLPVAPRLSLEARPEMGLAARGQSTPGPISLISCTKIT